jgi:hypothetical protein
MCCFGIWSSWGFYVADLAAVEATLVNLIAGIVFASPYLSGAYQASNVLAPFPPATQAAPNPTMVPIVTTIYRGWPEQARLDADLALGRAHVTVFSEPGMTQVVSRYPVSFEEVLPHAAPTVAWTVSGATATLTGSPSTPQNIGIVVDGAGFACAIVPGDTLGSAVVRLTALIAATRTATSAGTAITIPNAHAIAARVGTWGTSTAEVRRVKQGMRISVWTASPAARDALAGAIDVGIAGMLDPVSGVPTQDLALPDGTEAYLTYRTTYVTDQPSRGRLWRRDICLMVEYPTMATISSPEMIIPTLSTIVDDPMGREIAVIASITV